MKKWHVSAFAWLLVGACSSEEPGPKGSSRLRTEDAFCTEWALLACNEEVVRTCSSTQAGCRGRQENHCKSLLPAGYASNFAPGCLDAVEAAYEDAELTVEELGILTKLEGPCSQLVNGGRSEGDACEAHTECDTVRGYICVTKPGESLGTCQVPHTVGGGALCDAPEIVCDAGFFCEMGETRRRCAEPLGIGDSCSIDEECGWEARCDVPEGEETGECTSLLADGTDCTSDDQCLSGLCVVGATRSRCQSNIVLTGESVYCVDL